VPQQFCHAEHAADHHKHIENDGAGDQSNNPLDEVGLERGKIGLGASAVRAALAASAEISHGTATSRNAAVNASARFSLKPASCRRLACTNMSSAKAITQVDNQ
jgi:hypothetical protein